MRLHMIAIAALMSLGVAPAAIAQSGPTTGFDAPAPAPAPTPAPAPAPEPEPEPEPVETTQPPPPQAPQGEEAVREVFGDWELRCFGDSDECFIFQIATNSDGRPAAEMAIVNIPDGGAAAAAGVTLTLPLGVIIPEGIVLQVDSGRAQQFGYTFCVETGCIARIGLGQGFVQSMKAGTNLRMRVHAVNVPENPIELTISLTGVTAAFDALP